MEMQYLNRLQAFTKKKVVIQKYSKSQFPANGTFKDPISVMGIADTTETTHLQ